MTICYYFTNEENGELNILNCTVCLRSSDPFCKVSYYRKWVITSWTHSIREDRDPDLDQCFHEIWIRICFYKHLDINSYIVSMQTKYISETLCGRTQKSNKLLKVKIKMNRRPKKKKTHFGIAMNREKKHDILHGYLITAN